MENKSADFNILHTIIARLWRRTPKAEPFLALEVLSGEWKGVVFSFKTFEMFPERMEDGMVPTRFETEIHAIPKTLASNWTPDEAFDGYTKEVLFAWLSYLQVNNFSAFLQLPTDGRIH